MSSYAVISTHALRLHVTAVLREEWADRRLFLRLPNDWSVTWGSFKFSASYPASLSDGKGTLQVGEFSPKDGTFKKASIPLKFR
jgi:hypothetical protein